MVKKEPETRRQRLKLKKKLVRERSENGPDIFKVSFLIRTCGVIKCP
jgi:hypothetical protein